MKVKFCATRHVHDRIMYLLAIILSPEFCNFYLNIPLPVLTRMSDDIFYSESNPEYRVLTGLEWYLLNSYNYDSVREFSDIKIFDMQNERRKSVWSKKYALPYQENFCSGFNQNKDFLRLLQRYFCEKSCYWDPQICFLEDSHSGNLTDLMDRKFHNKFSSRFEEQFSNKKIEKIDWAPTGGIGWYPSIGLNNLLKNLGITTKLEYNANNLAVNFDHLKREYRDSDPTRPIYIFEVKKCNDILEALINVNKEKIETDKIEMERKYDESYKGNGPVRKPILSLMMWGPQVNFSLQKTDEKCIIENLWSNTSVHECTNFASKHYWMYTHSARVPCKTGPISVLQGPVMTSDLKILYPCNRDECNHDCLCDLCVSNHMCEINQHKIHLKEPNNECPIVMKTECQDHYIDHPDNYNKEEDIVVAKNLFYHNLELTNQPRNHTSEKIILAGIKKKCYVCRQNVTNHFKHHMIVHPQCRFCKYQVKNASDSSFWDKVCNICGKIFDDAKTLRYWHKKIHTSSWKCEICDFDFNRKWNLGRHLEEIHKMTLTETNSESANSYSDENSNSDSEISYTSEDISEDLDVDDEKSKNIECQYCGKTFSVQRYLDAHVKRTHADIKVLKCSECEKSFTLLHNLKRHIENTHSDHRENTCEFCGKKFSRVDNLKEHIKLIHLKETGNFVCSFCGRSFDRNWNMKRHEKRCIFSNSNKMI